MSLEVSLCQVRLLHSRRVLVVGGSSGDLLLVARLDLVGAPLTAFICIVGVLPVMSNDFHLSTSFVVCYSFRFVVALVVKVVVSILR